MVRIDAELMRWNPDDPRMRLLSRNIPIGMEANPAVQPVIDACLSCLQPGWEYRNSYLTRPPDFFDPFRLLTLIMENPNKSGLQKIHKLTIPKGLGECFSPPLQGMALEWAGVVLPPRYNALIEQALQKTNHSLETARVNFNIIRVERKHFYQTGVLCLDLSLADLRGPIYDTESAINQLEAKLVRQRVKLLALKDTLADKVSLFPNPSFNFLI